MKSNRSATTPSYVLFMIIGAVLLTAVVPLSAQEDPLVLPDEVIKNLKQHTDVKVSKDFGLWMDDRIGRQRYCRMIIAGSFPGDCTRHIGTELWDGPYLRCTRDRDCGMVDVYSCGECGNLTAIPRCLEGIPVTAICR